MVSVRQVISSASNQPSSSSSSSISSGIPSPSVSSNIDNISITYSDECSELFAQIVIFRDSNNDVAIPVIAPVLLWKIRSSGSSGYISQVITSPPNTNGCKASVV